MPSSEGYGGRPVVKTAWREGYHGLACIIAVAWDTQFSPVDARTLCERHRAVAGDRLVSDRQADGRKKTGRAAIGTVSNRTERLVEVYLNQCGAERLPDAVLFRTRTGLAYQDARMSRDFAVIRDLVFPGDDRLLMDMRRSGVVEAIAGGTDAVSLSAKLANSIGRSNTLHKTYAPVDIEAVRNVDEARVQGRRKIRAATEKGTKVSTSAARKSIN